jgi:hypothetical protein
MEGKKYFQSDMATKKPPRNHFYKFVISKIKKMLPLIYIYIYIYIYSCNLFKWVCTYCHLNLLQRKTNKCTLGLLKIVVHSAQKIVCCKVNMVSWLLGEEISTFFSLV